MYRAHTQHKDIHTLGSKRVVVDGGNRSASAGIDIRGCIILVAWLVMMLGDG